MTSKEFSVAEAKARFSSLLSAAEHGAEVVITRRGKPVIRLQRIAQDKAPIDFRRAEALRARLPVNPVPCARWLRAIRNQAR